MKKGKMAYIIPIIANRKNCRKSNPRALTAGLVIFSVFGVIFFLFFNRSRIFRFNFSIAFWIGGFMIFSTIILAIGATVSTASMNNRSLNLRNGNSYKQQNIYEKTLIKPNPYKRSPLEKEIKEDSDKNTFTEEIRYCRFCGAKKDLGAIFCYMCGSRFEE